MTFPMRFGRTPRRSRTSFYYSKISSVMSQTKLFRSAHMWNASALGFLPETNGSLKPDMPATSTLVSTTARALPLLVFCGNGDLRRTPLFKIAANRAQDFFVGYLSDVFSLSLCDSRNFFFHPGKSELKNQELVVRAWRC